MKHLFILTLMAASFSAHAGDLLTFQSSNGRSRVHSVREITISDNGEITRTVTTVLAKVTQESLGRLSANSVQNLKDLIETIADTDKVKDLAPRSPKCSDAPSSLLTVNKRNKVIKIQETAFCHTATVDNGSAYALVEIAMGLRNL